MRLSPMTVVTLASLGLSDDVLDGPFVMPSGTMGILVSLRGASGGAMPTPAGVHWHRDVPPALRSQPFHAFLRRPDRVVYLGAVAAVRRGRKQDPFKVSFDLVEPLEESAWRALVDEATAPLPPPAEEAIAALGPASTTDERIAAMQAFVTRWHGAASPAPVTVPAYAPRPLAELYTLAAGRSLCVQNRFVPPDELTVEDGRLTFYVENQGVFMHAIEPDADPPVLVSSDDGGIWQRDSYALSTFLLGTLILEATLGAPFGASVEELDKRPRARLAQRIGELSQLAWSTTGIRFFGGAGVIGFAYGDDGSVILGAQHAERFDAIESLVADWTDVRI